MSAQAAVVLGGTAVMAAATVAGAWLARRHSRQRETWSGAAAGAQGSPQVVWPDGSTTHNPGMSDHYWRGGLLRINSTDPGEPARLLQQYVAADPP